MEINEQAMENALGVGSTEVQILAKIQAGNYRHPEKRNSFLTYLNVVSELNTVQYQLIHYISLISVSVSEILRTLHL